MTATQAAITTDVVRALFSALLVGFALLMLRNAARAARRRALRVGFDARDWWIGYYRGDRHHYVCPLPTVVVRWRARSRRAA